MGKVKLRETAWPAHVHRARGGAGVGAPSVSDSRVSRFKKHLKITVLPTEKQESLWKAKVFCDPPYLSPQTVGGECPSNLFPLPLHTYFPSLGLSFLFCKVGAGECGTVMCFYVLNNLWGKPWFAAIANFHGANSLTMAAFKLDNGLSPARVGHL